MLGVAFKSLPLALFVHRHLRVKQLREVQMLVVVHLFRTTPYFRALPVSEPFSVKCCFQLEQVGVAFKSLPLALVASEKATSTSKVLATPDIS